MKKTVLASLLSLSAAATMSMSQPAAAENAREQVIIRCGEQAAVKGSPKYFTGSVRIDPLYPANNEMRSSGGSVTFEPGARSHWHVHPVGQALIVTSGVGRTQEWGKPIQEVRAGTSSFAPWASNTGTAPLPGAP